MSIGLALLSAFPDDHIGCMLMLIRMMNAALSSNELERLERGRIVAFVIARFAPVFCFASHKDGLLFQPHVFR